MTNTAGRLDPSSPATHLDGRRRTVGFLLNAMNVVKEGRTLSEQARRSLHEISRLVQGSAQLATQIAAASREQAQATRLVAGGMQALSNITVQSTKSAVGTNSAVKDLVALAAQLNLTISRFKIDGSALNRR